MTNTYELLQQHRKDYIKNFEPFDITIKSKETSTSHTHFGRATKDNYQESVDGQTLDIWYAFNNPNVQNFDGSLDLHVESTYKLNTFFGLSEYEDVVTLIEIGEQVLNFKQVNRNDKT